MLGARDRMGFFKHKAAYLVIGLPDDWITEQAEAERSF
jgi:hypothetical protein